MQTHRVTSYSEIENILGCKIGSSHCPFVFRGISSEYRLLPSMCYPHINIPVEHLEDLHEVTQEKFSEYIESQGFFSKYQKHFIGRHAGLISPYMDVTPDATIALQFGMEMAKDKPMHLYAINTDNVEWITTLPDNNGECVQIKIMNPILSASNIELIPQRTQFIQSGKLLHQPFNTISIPFDEAYPEIVQRFEIEPDNFDKIRYEMWPDKSMSTALLIDEPNEIFTEVKAINAKAIAFIKHKYNL